MFNKFYKGKDSVEILKLLLKKAMNESLCVIVLCKDSQIVESVSKYLWNYSIPHYIDGDPHIELNSVFVSVNLLPADFVIIYEDANDLGAENYSMRCYIGAFHVLDGEYWVYGKLGWNKVSKESFFQK